MRGQHVILRHTLLSIAFVLLFLLLNRPEVIVIARLGAVVWYPAMGLILAMMLGISPWYGILTGLSDTLAGLLIYNQPLTTYSQTIGSVAVASLYASAAYVLRGPLRIDLRLHRRRDVVLYVSVTTTAALASTGVGVMCLAADRAIHWSEFWQSASVWFLGDEIGLLGVAPFLLIHVFPWVRRQLSLGPLAETEEKHPLQTSGSWAVVELGGQICALLLSLWVLFGEPFVHFQASFLTFVPVIWAAMRQGTQRVATGLLALNFGIVVGLHYTPQPSALQPKYGLLMFVVSATGLIVASAVTERHRLAAELLERTAELVDANKQMIAARYKAEEASRIKSEFLANMSHEIRTPMNGIVGMTELVLETELTQEQRDYLTMAKSSGDALLGVIDDILDFSKVESGRLELDPVEFNLQDEIGETLRGLALRAQEKDLELACLVDPQLPTCVVGDSGRLRQVLVNLVGNAIKFTEQGEVVVEARLDSRSHEGLVLHFSVADTGIGIPAEKHALVFEAFAQADSSTTRNYGGTGLGLAICSRLVGLMGGRIWLESGTGKGSTFHFTVRFEVAERQSPHPVATKHIALQQVPVLVVDDNAANRRVLLEMLAVWGMKAMAVGSGGAALEAIDQAEASGAGFRLVIIDSRMPEMDGFQLADQLRQNRRLSSVMMLQSGQRGKVERCREMGITAYLLKPVLQVELLSAILTALGEKPGAGTPESLNRYGPQEKSRSLRILVAEDNPVNQRVVVSMLEKMGHVPSIAPNGLEAIAMIETEIYDLVFMDVQMPEMDGLTATRQIREGEKLTGQHIPIIAMTAHAIKGDKERCLEAGMDAYISKPVSSLGIAEKIAATFGVKPRGDEVVRGLPSGEPAPSWDRTKVLERVEGDETLLRELVQIFLEESPKQLTLLQRAIETANPEQIERTAHSLKGELSYLGLPEAARKAKDLEQMGHERTLRAAVNLFPAFRAEVSGATAAMRHLLAEKSEDR